MDLHFKFACRQVALTSCQPDYLGKVQEGAVSYTKWRGCANCSLSSDLPVLQEVLETSHEEVWSKTLAKSAAQKTGWQQLTSIMKSWKCRTTTAMLTCKITSIDVLGKGAVALLVKDTVCQGGPSKIPLHSQWLSLIGDSPSTLSTEQRKCCRVHITTTNQGYKALKRTHAAPKWTCYYVSPKGDSSVWR